MRSLGMRNEKITNKDAKVWDCGSKPAMTRVHFDTSSIRRDVARYVSTIRMCILILVSVFCLSSCEKADEYDRSPRANFEALWKIMDENYCFFSYKEVDWDAVHQRYAALITDTMNQYALFDTLGNMLRELKDGHTNLYSYFNTSRYWDWYLDYPDNFDWELIEDHYIGTDYAIAGGLRYTTLCDGQIGYIYYGSFSSSAGNNALNHIFYQFKDCKGLILDIRNNSGGLLSNAETIASRFIEEKRLVGYVQHKTGRGHDDFSELYPQYLEPSEGILWLRPVVVLTNRRCYSAANDFVLKVNPLPNVTTLGDRTGGGCGLPFNSELPNGWAVRFSASPMYDAQKQLTEFGIDPEIPVSLSEEDQKKGIDTLIERAIELLNAS